MNIEHNRLENICPEIISRFKSKFNKVTKFTKRFYNKK